MIRNNNDSNSNNKSSRLYLLYFVLCSPIGMAVWSSSSAVMLSWVRFMDMGLIPPASCVGLFPLLFFLVITDLSVATGALSVSKYASAGCSCGISLQQTAAFCPDCFGDKAEGKCHLPVPASEGLLGATMHPSPPELSGGAVPVLGTPKQGCAHGPAPCASQKGRGTDAGCLHSPGAGLVKSVAGDVL